MQLFLRRIFLCVCALLSAGSAAQAQNLSGTMYSALDSTMLSDKKVRLLDSSGVAIDSAYTDASGQFTFTQTGIEDNTHPHNVNLLHNYPNPFNPSTNIPLQLAKRTDVELNIYNIIGQEIIDYEGMLAAGNHTFKFKPGDECSAGLYIVSAETGQHVKSQKMMLTDKGRGETSLSLEGSFSAPLQKANTSQNAQYVLQVDEQNYAVFNSLPFEWDGTKEVNIPMIPDTLHYNPEHFSSFLNMVKRLTGTYRETASKLRQSHYPMEYYHVSDNVPQEPEDWEQLFYTGLGCDTLPEQGGIEGRTGVNLVKIMEGERGDWEFGKTKVNLFYSTAEEMPTGLDGAEGYTSFEDTWSGVLLTGHIDLNKTLMVTREQIIPVMQKEILRTVPLNDSPDPAHLMGGAGEGKRISDMEVNTIKIMSNMPRRYDMIQYSERKN